MPPRKKPLKLHAVPALVVTRTAIESKQLVYVLVADKEVRYTSGKSKIVYIGTTKRGLARVASSTAYQASAILKRQGIRKLSAYILTYQGVRGLKDMHKKLEKAALAMFKFKYGDKPLANKQGADILRNPNLFRYFHPNALLKRLDQFEEFETSQ
ncbi:MAG: hypothetical protein HY872_03355 [Chloroflexi bacterium]|nr:hypothetical protein [Chloroflexota bacterium]